jgi:MFS family permease
MAGIHIAAYATDVGIAPTSAALVITSMGGANILSKIIVGGVAAKRGTRFAVFLFLGMETIALFAFAATRELWMFFIVAMIFGVGIGGATPPLAAMVAEFFGLRSVGIIMGVIGVGWAAGCSLGTLLGDYIFDTTGSYVPAFLTTGCLAVITLILVLLLRKPRKKQEAY